MRIDGKKRAKRGGQPRNIRRSTKITSKQGSIRKDSSSASNGDCDEHRRDEVALGRGGNEHRRDYVALGEVRATRRKTNGSSNSCHDHFEDDNTVRVKDKTTASTGTDWRPRLRGALWDEVDTGNGHRRDEVALGARRNEHRRDQVALGEVRTMREYTGGDTCSGWRPRLRGSIGHDRSDTEASSGRDCREGDARRRHNRSYVQRTLSRRPVSYSPRPSSDRLEDVGQKSTRILRSVSRDAPRDESPCEDARQHCRGRAADDHGERRLRARGRDRHEGTTSASASHQLSAHPLQENTDQGSMTIPWQQPLQKESEIELAQFRAESGLLDTKPRLRSTRVTRRRTPERVDGSHWESSRWETGLVLTRDITPRSLRWTEIVCDESRRCYASVLAGLLSQQEKVAFFDNIQNDTNWLQPVGRDGRKIPRLTAWFVASHCECAYNYGGVSVPGAQFPKWMDCLLRVIMPACGIPRTGGWPSSCNANLYRNEREAVGWHMDDEPLFMGLHEDCLIVSLSLGASRDFEVRYNWPCAGDPQVIRATLGDGDLMVMEGMFQKHLQHRVPAGRRSVGPRVNLTWRWIKDHSEGCPLTSLASEGRAHGRESLPR